MLQCAAVFVTTVSNVDEGVINCRRDGVFDLCLLKKKRGEWEERIVPACHNCVAACCSVLQRVAACCSVWEERTGTKIACQQHNATTATQDCNTL